MLRVSFCSNSQLKKSFEEIKFYWPIDRRKGGLKNKLLYSESWMWCPIWAHFGKPTVGSVEIVERLSTWELVHKNSNV